MPPDDDNPAPGWLLAARRPEIAADLEAVFTLVADQIEARDPSCWASGRCCAFGSAGHRLYVTGLEAAYTVARLESPLRRDALDLAVARDDCPFLSANLCGVHTIKPVACRVYFCDRSAQAWQRDLAERAHALVRAVHDRHGVPYRYAEWRTQLALFL
ncbi:MAG: hypothetical protein HBSAPP03_07800 [Phycisphaerae bacterium]|nr:MAG: hypothetical protein HBSAPP03_07800 [Phycisphaerae bacterium]